MKIIIYAKNIEDASIDMEPFYTYAGGAVKPEPVVKDGNYTLVKNKDYKLSYQSNTSAYSEGYVYANGCGNYWGKLGCNFLVLPGSVSSFKISKIANQYYTGKALTPAPTITCSGNTLKKGKDYTLTYSNNKAIGTATITIKGKGSFTGSRKVTFKIVKAPVPSITMNKTSATLYTKVGASLKLKATLKNGSGAIKYKSSAASVASVSAKGVVTPKKAGKATITAYVVISGKTYKKTCAITVKNPSLTVKKASVTVKKGKTVNLGAKAVPSGTITYSSSNKKVATVTSKGVVKGVKKGTATITVKCNGVTKKVKVTVN